MNPIAGRLFYFSTPRFFFSPRRPSLSFPVLPAILRVVSGSFDGEKNKISREFLNLAREPYQ